jgi:hypothetical protein
MTALQLRKSIGRPPLRLGLPRVQPIWIIRGFVLIPLALACFALSTTPNAFGVSPAPDGGYPGANTAEGQNALLTLTTGGYNTAVGWYSLKSDTAGGYNTAIGAGTLSSNTADGNTATGAAALFKNTAGNDNTATGLIALYSNTTGGGNTANGAFALFSNTTGGGNTANGYLALQNNTTGFANTANGGGSLHDNITGTSNTASGYDALVSNNGNYNTASGVNTLESNTTGDGNTASGYKALVNNTIGFQNIALGFEAGTNVTTADHVICIGADGNNASNGCYIGQIFGATSSGGIAVFVNSNGRLGTSTSSRRFKEEIKPMEQASEALLALKPVRFRYKKEIDPQGIPQFGLVAEEVEKVSPDLVVRDKEGKPYSVRYEQINAMLLNEFLKEHRKVQKLEAALEAVNERFKAQDAKIQTVSAQIELSKFAKGRIRRGGPVQRVARINK